MNRLHRSMMAGILVGMSAVFSGPVLATESSHETSAGHRALVRALATVDSSLTVPGGQRVLLRALVTQGVQSYQCAPEGVWTLRTPMATLRGQQHQNVVHYIGPSWQYQDGSSIVAHTLVSVPRAGTIPELLLQVTAHGDRPGFFQSVNFVRRLFTTGGLPPSPACNPTRDTRGLNVPYDALYEFWGLRVPAADAED